MELQNHIDEFDDLGAQVWAVSADDQERVASFREQEGIEYTFLHDPDGAVFDAYGVRNERADRTIPHPTVVVVDSEMTARYVSSDENYRQRPPAAEVVEAVRAVVSPDGVAGTAAGVDSRYEQVSPPPVQ